MATAKEVGAHLDVSDRTVRELQAKGVLPASEGRGSLDLDACRIAYVRHLREQAAGRKGEGGKGLDLAEERARLASEQADAVEMKNALARGELVAVSAVTSAVIGAVEMAKARLLRVPATVAKDDLALRERLDRALREAMEDLSATRVLEAPGEEEDGGEVPPDDPAA